MFLSPGGHTLCILEDLPWEPSHLYSDLSSVFFLNEYPLRIWWFKQSSLGCPLICAVQSARLVIRATHRIFLVQFSFPKKSLVEFRSQWKEKLVKIHLPAFVVPNADEGRVRKEVYGRGALCGQRLTELYALDTEQLVAAALCPISLSPSSYYLTLLLRKQDTGTPSIFCLSCVPPVVWWTVSMLSLILTCCLVNRFPGRVEVGVLQMSFQAVVISIYG